jgi:hypothetical protein
VPPSCEAADRAVRPVGLPRKVRGRHVLAVVFPLFAPHRAGVGTLVEQMRSVPHRSRQSDRQAAHLGPAYAPLVVQGRDDSVRDHHPGLQSVASRGDRRGPLARLPNPIRMTSVELLGRGRPAYVSIATLSVVTMTAALWTARTVGG